MKGRFMIGDFIVDPNNYRAYLPTIKDIYEEYYKSGRFNDEEIVGFTIVECSPGGDSVSLNGFSIDEIYIRVAIGLCLLEDGVLLEYSKDHYFFQRIEEFIEKNDIYEYVEDLVKEEKKHFFNDLNNIRKIYLGSDYKPM